MVSKDDIRTVVGILGNVISMILFSSPLPTFIRIYKKKAVEQYSATPYLAALVNCALWVLYGLPMVHPNSLLVVTINGAGFGIELLFLIFYIIFSDRKKRIRVVLIMLAEFVFVAILAVLVLILAQTSKLRGMIVGSICMVGNVLMYASPLSIMKMVITTKSVEYMPFSLSLAAFANSICWSTYALIRFDPFIVAPNGLGILFAIVQLLLYATYYKNTKRLMAERREKRELGIVEGANPSEDLKRINIEAEIGEP